MDFDEKLFEMAKIKVEKRRDFFTHFTVYLLINGLVWTVFLLDGTNTFPWPIFMTVFWGIGVLAHAIETFVNDESYSDAVEKEYQKMLSRKK